VDDDPYAFCHEIEKDAAAAFDKAGLAAFEKQIRERFEAASADPSSWPYRHCSKIIREIYRSQRNIQAYIRLTEEYGPIVFLPESQDPDPDPDATILIRSSEEVTSLVSSLKNTAARNDPGIVLNFSVLRTLIREGLWDSPTQKRHCRLNFQAPLRHFADMA